MLPVTGAARLVACPAAAYGTHKRAAEPPRRNLQTESTIRQAHTIYADADRTRIAGGASLCREAAAAAVHLGAARVYVCLAGRSARGERHPFPKPLTLNPTTPSLHKSPGASSEGGCRLGQHLQQVHLCSTSDMLACPFAGFRWSSIVRPAQLHPRTSTASTSQRSV